MRALRFHHTGGPEVLQIDDVPIPQPGPADVLIRVEAAGLNFADTIRRRGNFYPAPTPLPFTTGGECVGMVEAVGDAVDPARLGTRVCSMADGACAEYVLSPAAGTFAFPDGLDPVEGIAIFVAGLTASLLLHQAAGLRPGQSVFVEGAAGGVGSLAVQLAKSGGAGLIIGGASGADKHAQVLDLGADLAVEYRTPGWGSQLRDATAGRGVDIALNMAGQDAFDEELANLAPQGTLVVFGSASGPPPTVDVAKLFGGVQTVTAFILGAYAGDRGLIEATLQGLASDLRDGRLRTVVGGRFDLDQVGRAHRSLEAGRSMGKLVVVP